jgi:hypothetical protein
MRKFLRYLRIVSSATCLIACVLLITLWVRSYWWGDAVAWQFGIIDSIRGQVRFLKCEVRIPGIIRFSQNLHQAEERGTYMAVSGKWGYDFGHTPQKLTSSFPHLVPIAVVVSCAIVPWLPCRFSLRTLLIATTLVAVVLGLSVWVVR